MSEANPVKATTDGGNEPKTLKPKRILVASSGGKVGKSTVTGTLLQPNLNALIYSVESSNEDASRYGIDVVKYSADDLEEMQSELAIEPSNIVIDVGASNFESFRKRLVIENMAGDFTHVVGVADPTERGQLEAIDTFEALTAVGFDPATYRFILNRMRILPKTANEIKAQYPILFKYAESNERMVLNVNCFLPEHPVFAKMATMHRTWAQSLSEGINHAERGMKLRAAGKKEEARKAGDEYVLQKWAIGARDFMDRAFAELYIPA